MTTSEKDSSLEQEYEIDNEEYLKLLNKKGEVIILINKKPACYLNINVIKKIFSLCEHNFDDCFDFVSFGIYDKKEIEKIKKKTYKAYQYNFPSKNNNNNSESEDFKSSDDEKEIPNKNEKKSISNKNNYEINKNNYIQNNIQNNIQNKIQNNNKSSSDKYNYFVTLEYHPEYMEKIKKKKEEENARYNQVLILEKDYDRMIIHLEKEQTDENENKQSKTNEEKTYYLDKNPKKENNDNLETKTKEKKEVIYNIEKVPIKNENEYKQTTNEEKTYIIDKDPTKIKKEEEPLLTTTVKEEKTYIIDKDPTKIKKEEEPQLITTVKEEKTYFIDKDPSKIKKEEEPQIITTTKEEKTYFVDKDLTKKQENNENEVTNTEKPEEQKNTEKQTNEIEENKKITGRSLKLPKIEPLKTSKSEKLFKVNMDKDLTKDNIQIIEPQDDLEYKYGLEKYPKFDPNNINWVKPIYDWVPKPSTFKLPYYEALELDDINAKIDTGLSLIQNRKNFFTKQRQ